MGKPDFLTALKVELDENKDDLLYIPKFLQRKAGDGRDWDIQRGLPKYSGHTTKEPAKPKSVSDIEATVKTQKSTMLNAPTKRRSKELDEFGFAKGSINSMAAALYGREEGATTAEIKNRLGSPQLNLFKVLAKKGYTIKKEQTKTEEGRKVTRYFIIRPNGGDHA